MSNPESSNAGIQIVDLPPRPTPRAPRSSHHLSEDQIRFFDTNGYLVLKHWITGELLEHLRAAGEAWIAQGEALRNRQQSGLPLGPDEQELLDDLAFGFQKGW